MLNEIKEIRKDIKEIHIYKIIHKIICARFY